MPSRTTVLIACLLLIVQATGLVVADPAPPADADPDGDARASLVAVSGDGNATCEEAPLIPGYAPKCIAIAPGGNASGGYANVAMDDAAGYCHALSLQGDARGNPGYIDCLALALTGDATGGHALSPLGNAQGGPTAASLLGDAHACPTYLVLCLAASGTGNASGGSALSLLGDADANWFAASLLGDAHGALVTGSAGGNATSGWIAASGHGDASGDPSGSLLATSATGDAEGDPLVGASGTGNASGFASASATGCAEGNLDVDRCNVLVVEPTDDAESQVLAVSATGDATCEENLCVAVTGTGDATGGYVSASGTGDATAGLLAASLMGNATANQPVGVLGSCSRGHGDASPCLGSGENTTTRGPIVIVGDAGFLAPGSGVTGGSGTASDPYVIEDWSAPSVTLLGTSAHVVVRGNVLSSPSYGTHCDQRGILGIDHLPIRGHQGEVVTVLHASNVTLEGNLVAGGTCGVRVQDSHHATLRDNRIVGAGTDGVFLANIHHVTVEGNDIASTLQGVNAGGSWITLFDYDYGYYNVSDVRIADNHIHDILDEGILLFGEGSSVEGNHLEDVVDGMLVGGTGHAIVANTLERSRHLRIQGSGHHVLGNHLDTPGYDGIIVRGAEHHVEGNTVVNTREPAAALTVLGNTVNVTLAGNVAEAGVNMWYGGEHTGFTLRNNTLGGSIDIEVDRLTTCEVSGNHAHGSEEGIQMDRRYGGTIEGCRIVGNTVTNTTDGSGLWVSGAGGDIEVSGNTVTGTRFAGIVVYGTTGITVANNTATGSGAAGITVSAAEASVVDNVARGNAWTGFVVGVRGEHVTMARNLAEDNLNYGIYTVTPWNEPDLPVTVESNTVRGNDGTGLFVYRSTDPHILGNHVEANGGDGIVLYRGEGGYLQGNTVTGSGLSAMALSYHTNATLLDNTLEGAAFEVAGYERGHFVHTVVDTTVDGAPVVVAVGAEDATVGAGAGALVLVDARNVTVDPTLGNRATVAIVDSRNVTLANHTAPDLHTGQAVLVLGSQDVHLEDLDLGEAATGVRAESSSGVTLVDSRIEAAVVAVRYGDVDRGRVERVEAPGTSLADLVLSSATNATVRDNTLTRGLALLTPDACAQPCDSRAHLRHDIAGNTVDGKPLVYVTDAPSTTVTSPAGQVILVNVTSAHVTNQAMEGPVYGIDAREGTSLVAENVTVRNATAYGVVLQGVGDATLRDVVLVDGRAASLFVRTAGDLLVEDAVLARYEDHHPWWSRAGYVTDASEVTLRRTSVTDASAPWGASLRLYRLGPVTVEDSSFVGSVGRALQVIGSPSVNIHGSVFANNQAGVIVSTAQQVNLTHNEFRGNDWYGVYLPPDAVGTVRDNVVTGNRYGFYMWTDGVVLRGNNMWNHSHSAVYAGWNTAVDAEENWWGCPEGPGQEGCDDASALVDYDPWLREPNPDAGRTT